jgi:predicted secreted hydrolase
MAHFALTDAQGREHRAFERLGRGAAGLAGAQAAPYEVWLDDWSVQEVRPGTVRLRAAQDGLALDLLLAERKGPILNGDRGYSQKGPDPGNASYYYSLTRLETSGTVQAGGRSFDVSGWSWMDHEWSTSSLSAGQVGWDWFSIQLDDGSELMVFQLRREDGSVDPFSSGTLIAADGTARRLDRGDFDIQVLDTWRSPQSGAAYPSGWTVSVPSAGLTLDIEPFLANQELSVSYAYWEGAVRVRGTRSDRPVTGSGYVELTGYAGSMAGQF